MSLMSNRYPVILGPMEEGRRKDKALTLVANPRSVGQGAMVVEFQKHSRYYLNEAIPSTML